jgi:4-hydroxy-4-methyl-2-oxoglutarate aldolase
LGMEIYSTATLYEASGQRGALPFAIKPVAKNFKIAGRAFTVSCGAKDNLWLHRGIYAAQLGEILVVSTNNAYEAGYWGEIMTYAALQRKLGGLVIDGCVRDIEQLEILKFPIFARGLCIKGTTKDKESQGNMGGNVQIGDVSIVTGDFIFGDRDGVIAVPQQILPDVIEKAKERENKEAKIIEALKSGATTLEIYKFP